MTLLQWLLFGVSVGIIATLIDSHRNKNGGYIAGVILSVTGVLLALFMAHLIFNIPATINFTTALIAIYGAVMFILTGRGLRRL